MLLELAHWEHSVGVQRRKHYMEALHKLQPVPQGGKALIKWGKWHLTSSPQPWLHKDRSKTLLGKNVFYTPALSCYLPTLGDGKSGCSVRVSHAQLHPASLFLSPTELRCDIFQKFTFTEIQF